MSLDDVIELTLSEKEGFSGLTRREREVAALIAQVNPIAKLPKR